MQLPTPLNEAWNNRYINPGYDQLQELLKGRYSQGSNTEHSNSESIRKPNILKVGFQMLQTILKLNLLPFENRNMASLGRFVFIKKLYLYETT